MSKISYHRTITRELIAYVKYKGDNLSTLTQVLTLVVNFGPLGLVILWRGYVLVMLSTKHANMIVMILKVYIGFREVSLKATQFTL
jgi:hypothetical protein